jgi:hypothetical protein
MGLGAPECASGGVLALPSAILQKEEFQGNFSDVIG